jgi:uncharacterized membrane-anchored protein YhcB (DUF1043 family)
MFWIGVAVGLIIGAFIGVLVLSAFRYISGREELMTSNERR